MKQRIRLTEGQLHRIIDESVRNVLTELDWKTYASAERKVADLLKNHKHFRPYDDRAAFIKKAEEEYQKTLPKGVWTAGPEYFIDQIDRGGRADDYGSGTLYFDNDDYSLDDFGKALSGRNSVMDFYNGKYEYEPKGRGWHLKDEMK